MKTKTPKVYYVGMISLDEYGAHHAVDIYSGAAAKKMTSVTSAMRQANIKATIVSLPSVGRKAKKGKYSRWIHTRDKSPVVHLGTYRSRVKRKVFGSVTIGAFVWRKIHASDTVIFYNHALEYIPALAVALIKRAKIVLDIEDAPNSDVGGLGGLLDKWIFSLFLNFSSPNKMVVADHVAKRLQLKKYVTIRGVANLRSQSAIRTNSLSKWNSLTSGGAFRVHYGGTLISETGVDLFCDAIRHLRQRHRDIGSSFEFFVTGVGDIEKVQTVCSEASDCGNLSVKVLPSLEAETYRALISTCHVSLSLKDPHSDMSATTFPSKVIEIATNDMAIVSAKISDVEQIFAPDGAFFLNEYSSLELANLLLHMCEEPCATRKIAQKGLQICEENFSPEKVAAAMRKLI